MSIGISELIEDAMDQRKTYPNQTTPPELEGRNRKILALSRAGATCQELADMYQISRQRVWQILDRAQRMERRA